VPRARGPRGGGPRTGGGMGMMHARKGETHMILMNRHPEAPALAPVGAMNAMLRLRCDTKDSSRCCTDG
jgi:hypothetical protein